MSPSDRPEIGRGKDALKSRVANGSEILPGVDGRSREARRYREIVHALLADAGPIEQIGAAKRELIRRFAGAALLAEQQEAKITRGEAVDASEHATLCSLLTRLAARIGIGQSKKSFVPSVDDYLATKALNDKTASAR